MRSIRRNFWIVIGPLIILLASTTLAAGVFFSDIQPDHPYGYDINIAIERGYFTGYSDGTFKPDRQITSNQLSRIISRAFPDGITRAEAAVFLVRGADALEDARQNALQTLSNECSGTGTFTDPLVNCSWGDESYGWVGISYAGEIPPERLDRLSPNEAKVVVVVYFKNTGEHIYRFGRDVSIASNGTAIEIDNYKCPDDWELENSFSSVSILPGKSFFWHECGIVHRSAIENGTALVSIDSLTRDPAWFEVRAFCAAPQSGNFWFGPPGQCPPEWLDAWNARR